MPRRRRRAGAVRPPARAGGPFRHRATWLPLLAAVLGVLWWFQPSGLSLTESSSAGSDAQAALFAERLPAEAAETLRRIRAGGPYPYSQDGTVFFNREGLLPTKPRGYYREFTVDTPGLSHRGARRIVTGGDPPEVWYYTDDHYASFRRFEPLP